jgi:hypothetical protein
MKRLIGLNSKPIKLKSKQTDWTKITAVAQLSSNLLIGVLGVIATVAVNRWQHQASEDQLALQKVIADNQQQTLRQQFTQQQALAERQFSYQRQLDAAKAEAEAAAKIANYANEIESAQARQGYDGKASLVGAIDIVTDANSAVALALRYAYPNKNENEWSNKVSDAALAVLKRERIKGKKQLLAISHETDTQGDGFVRGQIATGLVSGRDQRLFLRVSDIKGSAEVRVDYSQATVWMEGAPTGWVELTKQVHPGKNRIEVVVNGNPSGSPCGVRLQLSAGTQQYDRSIVLRECPALRRTYRTAFEVDVGAWPDHIEIFLHVPKTFIAPGVDFGNCVLGCDPFEKTPDSEVVQAGPK